MEGPPGSPLATPLCVVLNTKISEYRAAKADCPSGKGVSTEAALHAKPNGKRCKQADRFIGVPTEVESSMTRFEVLGLGLEA